MKILLVIAYVSMSGVPQIKVYQRDSQIQCLSEASKVYAKVKAGTVRAWCHKVNGGEGK